MNLSLIITANSVTVYIDGRPYTYVKGSELYPAVYDAIRRNDEAGIRKIINIKQTVAAASFGLVTIENDELMFDGKPLHNALTERIVGLFRDGVDVTPFTKFLENLRKNPSKRAVDELYSWLERCNLPITPDGHFLAYKMVRSDFMDKYRGVFDNTPGNVCEMPRNEVDDDKERTCSDGLHFASRHYIESGSYGHRASGDRMVVVKINPADVVSIPVDYEFSKGRTCRYEVVEEIEWDTEIKPYFSADSFGDDEPEEEEEGYDDEPEEELDEEEEEDTTDSLPVTPRLFGTANPAATLDERKVREIRKLLADDWQLTAISKTMGVSRRTVARIRDGEAWTHVK